MTYSKEDKRNRQRSTSSSLGLGLGLFKCFRSTVNDEAASRNAGGLKPPARIAEDGYDTFGKRRIHPGTAASTGRSAGALTPPSRLFSSRRLWKSRKRKCSRELLSAMANDSTDSAGGSGRTTCLSGATATSSSLSLDSSRCSSLSSSSRSYDSSQKLSRTSSFASGKRPCGDAKEQGLQQAHDGLCLLFAALLVVVMWGKACAIICASTLLYVMSYRKITAAHPRVSGGVCDLDQMDTAEYKKRVILGGFLDRKRSRGVGCPSKDR
ncbi:hypothetical protein SAY87_021268 [Trapa incisa]|uniref:Transmembrane protein n=1 Tax=Trapa incisa TaxID=236973 RepID=A0AAN7JT31_9MYRT|nr:hypothetical protein SAY87_021268 [Trapa incisa]